MFQCTGSTSILYPAKASGGARGVGAAVETDVAASTHYFNFFDKPTSTIRTRMLDRSDGRNAVTSVGRARQAQ